MNNRDKFDDFNRKIAAFILVSGCIMSPNSIISELNSGNIAHASNMMLRYAGPINYQEYFEPQIQTSPVFRYAGPIKPQTSSNNAKKEKAKRNKQEVIEKYAGPIEPDLNDNSKFKKPDVMVRYAGPIKLETLDIDNSISPKDIGVPEVELPKEQK